MNRWMYVASDARACMADTRLLVLKHGLVWHAKPADKRPAPGDRLLLAFRTSTGELSSLAILELEGAAQRLATQLDKVSSRNPAYGEGVWPSVWDEFEAARWGRGGSGYRANAARRVLVVRVVDALDDVWLRHDEVFTAPSAARFGMRLLGNDVAEVLTALPSNVEFEGQLASRLGAGMMVLLRSNKRASAPHAP